LLLGRPWQYDTDSLHHGRSNHYSFMFKGQKIIPQNERKQTGLNRNFARRFSPPCAAVVHAVVHAVVPAP
ncbi:hypothetical protein VN21_16700, partial [Paraclostridium benzoelyticum]